MAEAEALKELGRRLAKRRAEAHLDVQTLAARARVPQVGIESFERGEGQLGVSALTRIAAALGVPEAAFLHTEAPETSAPVEPTFLLSAAGLSARVTKADQRTLGAHLERARVFSALGGTLRLGELAAKFAPRPAPATKAYRAGYDLSRTARELLRLGGGPIRDLRGVLEDRFNILVVAQAFSDARVRAAACRSGDARLVAWHSAQRRETALRFVLAHELCHHLADLDAGSALTDEDDQDFSFNKPPSEQRAGAFAAMFLAPREGVAALLGVPKRELLTTTGHNAVTDCRQTFGLGFEAMAWHLFALGYFDCNEDEMSAFVRTGDTVEVQGFESEDRRDGLVRRVERALASDVISSERARQFLGSPAAP